MVISGQLYFLVSGCVTLEPGPSFFLLNGYVVSVPNGNRIEKVPSGNETTLYEARLLTRLRVNNYATSIWLGDYYSLSRSPTCTYIPGTYISLTAV